MCYADIDGFQNEHEFSKYLNGQRVKNLNPIFSDFIYGIYGKLSSDYVIHTKVDYGKKKFDLIIEINNVIKRISIKKGVNNSVHVEGISSFIHFLIDSGVCREAIIEYLKYHYADGTTNGSGKFRLSGAEYKEKNPGKINFINSQINNPYIVERAINRFVLQGKNSNIKIDAIIYGTVNDFLWITSEDIRRIILNKIDMVSNGIHFGQLFCQPMNRCLNYNSKYEKKRFCIQIKWYSIFDDIIQNMNSKSLNNS